MARKKIKDLLKPKKKPVVEKPIEVKKPVAQETWKVQPYNL